MKKKSFSIPICFCAILVFCSFNGPRKDNSRISFSAKIDAVFGGYISIHTTLKNNTNDTIEYYLDNCNPQECFFLTDTTYFCSPIIECEEHGLVLYKMAPNAILENDPFCPIRDSMEHPKKFRIGFNFVTPRMVKDMEVKDWKRDTDTHYTHNIIWSDTLEIK